MSTFIHPTSVIDKENVEIGENVYIGPYSVINKNVKIGNNTILKASVYIDSYVNIGENNTIFPNAVLGCIPQDLKFEDEVSYLEIGNNNVIRESVTMSRGTHHGGGKTQVGDGSMFMAYSHVAHDCQLGNNLVLANSATLAGHVEIEDDVIIGGLTAIHQFVKIGKNSIIGGMSRIPKDILPFSKVAGIPSKCFGANTIGLERHGFSEERINNINKILKTFISKKYNLKQAIKLITEKYMEDADAQYILNFIKNSKRGILI